MKTIQVLLLAASVVTAAACKRGADTPAVVDSGAQVADTSEMAKLKSSDAEKDSLIQDLLATTRFVNEINTELGKVRGLKAGSRTKIKQEDGTLVTASEYRAGILARIKELTTRLEESEARLAESKTRVESASNDPHLLEQIAEYQRTLTEYRDIVEDQRKEISALSARVNSLTAEVGSLSAERAKLADANSSLSDSVMTLAESENTVFWIAGTKDELKAQGVIVEEGGGGLFRRGGTLQPSRKLDDGKFTPVNKMQTSQISLPKPNYWYKIITRQSLEFATGVSKDRVRGALAISDPARFWAISRHLILVEDGK